MRFIDLHTHSTASDGTDSPSELVRKALDLDLGALAITDHDTVGGLDEGAEAAEGTGLEFVRGCEISTMTDQGNMHVLGLWIPKDCRILESFLAHLRGMRHKRNEDLIQKLRALGINITMDEVIARADGAPGRPHIAAIMVEKGYVKNSDAAFRDWLGIKGKAYVPKVAPRPEQALRLLKEIGATPVLAHPLLRERPEGWLDDFIKELAPLGLDGLEAWHSRQSPQDAEELIGLARKYGLGLSGGSDYHGANKKDIDLGSGKNGNVRVGADILENLKARRKAQGLPV